MGQRGGVLRKVGCSKTEAGRLCGANLRRSRRCDGRAACLARDYYRERERLR